MSYNTYIINMASATDRWNKISNNLDNLGINYSRFDAIDGRNIGNRYDEYISPMKPVIPDGIVGCGLSHFLVAKRHFDNNDNIALILEDDSIPMFNDKNIIHEVIEKAPKDWDIILLYSQGITNYRDNTWEITSKFATGSSAAYLINRSGYQKRYNNGDYKLLTHTDAERGLYKANVYKTPTPLFMPCDRLGGSCKTEVSSTSNNYSTNVFGVFADLFYRDNTELNVTGCSGSQLFEYNIIKIPGTNVNLDTGRIMMIVIPLMAIIIMFIIKPAKDHLAVFVFLIFLIFLSVFLLIKSVFSIIGATQFHN